MIEETMYLCEKEIFNENGKILRKSSHRAIIFKEDKLLMAYVGKYHDYRFPGGKLDPGESIESGLAREVLEETGATVTSILPYANIVTRNIERFKRDYDFFELDTYYYICEIEDELTSLTLDENEINDQFDIAWISVEDALEANKKIMKSDCVPLVIERETRMLEILKDYIITTNLRNNP